MEEIAKKIKKQNCYTTEHNLILSRGITKVTLPIPSSPQFRENRLEKPGELPNTARYCGKEAYTN